MIITNSSLSTSGWFYCRADSRVAFGEKATQGMLLEGRCIHYLQLSPFGRRTSTSRDDSDRHNSDTTSSRIITKCALTVTLLCAVVDDCLKWLIHRRFIMVLLWLTAYDKRVNGMSIAAMMAGVKARSYDECNSDDLWLELLSTHMIRALM
eukprot:scaffold73458_cov67-Cyclotella_meneghiniana.AAC.2